jgi:hypothetical protein
VVGSPIPTEDFGAGILWLLATQPRSMRMNVAPVMSLLPVELPPAVGARNDGVRSPVQRSGV